MSPRWNAALLCPLLAVSTLMVAFAGEAPPTARPGATASDETLPSPKAPELKSTERIREGSKVTDLVGTFRLNGDRLSFTTSHGEQRFETLENTTLERVARAVKENRDLGEWRVSGVVTEYLGTNFLLVTRAILRAKSAGDSRN